MLTIDFSETLKILQQHAFAAAAEPNGAKIGAQKVILRTEMGFITNI